MPLPAPGPVLRDAPGIASYFRERATPESVEQVLRSCLDACQALNADELVAAVAALVEHASSMELVARRWVTVLLAHPVATLPGLAPSLLIRIAALPAVGADEKLILVREALGMLDPCTLAVLKETAHEWRHWSACRATLGAAVREAAMPASQIKRIFLVYEQLEGIPTGDWRWLLALDRELSGLSGRGWAEHVVRLLGACEAPEPWRLVVQYAQEEGVLDTGLLKRLLITMPIGGRAEPWLVMLEAVRKVAPPDADSTLVALVLSGMSGGRAHPPDAWRQLIRIAVQSSDPALDRYALAEALVNAGIHDAHCWRALIERGVAGDVIPQLESLAWVQHAPVETWLAHFEALLQKTDFRNVASTVPCLRQMLSRGGQHLQRSQWQALITWSLDEGRLPATELLHVLMRARSVPEWLWPPLATELAKNTSSDELEELFDDMELPPGVSPGLLDSLSAQWIALPSLPLAARLRWSVLLAEHMAVPSATTRRWAQALAETLGLPAQSARLSGDAADLRLMVAACANDDVIIQDHFPAVLHSAFTTGRLMLDALPDVQAHRASVRRAHPAVNWQFLADAQAGATAGAVARDFCTSPEFGKPLLALGAAMLDLGRALQKSLHGLPDKDPKRRALAAQLRPLLPRLATLLPADEVPNPLRLAELVQRLEAQPWAQRSTPTRKLADQLLVTRNGKPELRSRVRDALDALTASEVLNRLPEVAPMLQHLQAVRADAQARIAQPGSAAELQRLRAFRVALLDKDAIETLSVGHEVGCCMAPTDDRDEGAQFHDFIHRLIEPAWVPVAVHDEGGVPVAVSWSVLSTTLHQPGPVRWVADFHDLKPRYTQARSVGGRQMQNPDGEEIMRQLLASLPALAARAGATEVWIGRQQYGRMTDFACFGPLGYEQLPDVGMLRNESSHTFKRQDDYFDNLGLDGQRFARLWTAS